MRLAFDLLNHPLDGVQLIEASAGTGKTWTLCALYLRLQLEKKLDVGRILVVTLPERRPPSCANGFARASMIWRTPSRTAKTPRTRWRAAGLRTARRNASRRSCGSNAHSIILIRRRFTPFMAFASARFWMHRLPARIRRNLRFRKTMKRCGLNAR